MVIRGAASQLVLDDFSGGEAAIFNHASMPAKFSLMLQNCHVSDRKGIAKVPGYKKITAGTVPVKLSSGFEYLKRDGTKIIVSAGGGYIYKKNADDTLTSIATGLNTAARYSFAMMNNLCLMGNGVDAPKKYDGTTVSALGGTPPATAFKFHVHKGRVWVLERTNKLLASHSALNNPEDWTTANDAGYLDFAFILKSGDELLDVASFADYIVFFFRHHIAVYSGTVPSGTSSNFKLEQLIENSGVVDTGTVAELGNDLAYLDMTGAKALSQVITTGALNQGNISLYIDPVLKGEIRANPGLPYASVHYPAKSWYMVTVGDKIFAYDYRFKAWARLVGGDFAGLFPGAGGKLYVCGNGMLYEYGKTWSYHDRPINMAWHTGWWTPGKRGDRFFPKFAEIENYQGLSLPVGLALCYDEAGATYTTSFNTNPTASLMDTPLAGPLDDTFLMDHATHEPVRVPLFGAGKSMRMVFSNNSDKGPIEITKIILQGKMGRL